MVLGGVTLEFDVHTAREPAQAWFTSHEPGVTDSAYTLEQVCRGPMWKTDERNQSFSACVPRCARTRLHAIR